VLAPGRDPLTFAGLWARMQEFAGALAGPHPITAIVLTDGPELLTALLGAMLAGAAAPLNPELTESELRRQLASLQPDYVWRGGSFEVGPAHTRRSLPPDTRLLLHTSGTTDRPKVAPLSGANLRASIAHQRRCFALTAADRFLCLAPLYHLHGFASALAQLAAGGSVVCPAGFDACAFPEWLREFRPTWYTGGPALHRAVASLAAGAGGLPCDSLRMVRSSSAALENGVRESLERLLGVPLLDSYGLTETGTVAANPLSPLPRKPGSCGVSAGPEIAILGPDGEIAVRGPNVIAGYLDDAAANAEAFRDGWFLTGDLGHLDEDGYLFVTGRRKDVINRGGAKLMPAEIEAALMAHPRVAEAAAFGVPHAGLGEEVEAVVVLRASAAITESELRAYAAERLADFKIPRRIHFTSAIPLTSTGKPRRADLPALFASPAGKPATRYLSADESRIAAIWRRVLACEEITPGGDFFALGGDSLSAAVMLAEVQAEFATATPQFAFFEHPTVEHLARFVTAGTLRPACGAAVHVAGHGPGIPVFSIPALGTDPYYLRHLATSMDGQRPFYVLVKPLDRAESMPTVEGIARAMVGDIRSARPHGPYVLAGHCSGGLVAYEAALQMHAAGDEVRLLILLDTPTPGYPKAIPRWKRYAPAAWNLLRAASPLALARETAAHCRMLIVNRRRPAQPVHDDLSAVGRILHSYVPQPLDVPMVQVLSSGHEVSTRVLEDARLGWRDFARTGFTVVDAPGDHQSFLLPPHVDEAVRRLQPILNTTAR
jgi:acyl-CoA synthetase (AMP-forming)/AMP-acid ligase II/thioesterase domain-containing protein